MAQASIDIPVGLRSLPAAFRHMAERHPDRAAVVDGDTRLTYGELDAFSDRLAAGLAGRGLDPGVFVGILIDRTVRTPVAILGVLKAGCAYVPLDPEYPEERLRHVVDDTGLGLLVGEAAAAQKCGLGGITTLTVDWAPEGSGADDIADIADIAGESTAYVIHTSGSTGTPKGCVITHENVLALMRHGLPLFDIGPADRWALFHSSGFDFSVLELWGALLTGGTAICVSDVEARSPENFIDLIEREGVTVLNQIPSVFRIFSRVHAELGAPRLPLRYVIFGGENVDLDVVADFQGRTPDGGGPVMVNMYGITETTVLSTIQVIGQAQLGGEVRSPIGVPLPHVTIRLLDEHMRDVADGEVGELYIGGRAVGTGYLNRPELTAERFRTVDTADGPRRFYKSGDLARRGRGGALEYLGRNDHQVKVNGFRIELGEIEEVLRGHDLVRDVAVAATAHPENGLQLTAFVVTDTEMPIRTLALELRRYALKELPRHMVPRKYHPVPQLPLTPSGKLDRQALVGSPVNEPSANEPSANEPSVEETSHG
jgi:amino acid adenylation domain-containing protein